MRQPLIINAQPSPLAQAFDNIARGIASAPSMEERRLRDAQSRYYGAQASQAEDQIGALRGAKSTLADLFMPQEAPPPSPEAVGPMPQESEAQRGGRMQAGLADLFARVGKDNASAMRSGLEAALTYGTPDQMRQSMVMQGKAISPDFAPTMQQAGEIANRNTDLEIARDAAKPRTLSQVKGAFAQEHMGNLAGLNPLEQQFIGAKPSGGMQITTNPDGTTTVSMGGGGGGWEKSVKSGIQKKSVSLDDMEGMLNLYESAVAAAPDNAFGTAGLATGISRDLLAQGANIGKALNSMGYNTDPQAGGTPISQAYDQMKAEAMASGLSEDALGTLFSAADAGDELSQLHSVLLYSGAAALAGQEGRSATDKDIERIGRSIPDPRGLLGTKDKSMRGIGVTREMIQSLRGSTPQGIVPSQNIPQAPARPMPQETGGAVRVSTPEEAMALPSGTVFIDPNGNRRVRP